MFQYLCRPELGMKLTAGLDAIMLKVLPFTSTDPPG